MITFELSNIYLGDISLNQAKDIVFSHKVMRQVHGNDTEITPWVSNKRTVKFKMDLPAKEIPSVMRRFLPSNNIKVVATQRIKPSTPNRHEVIVHIKMNCLGSQLVSVNPIFVLRENLGKKGTYFDARVSVNVWAPPPINHIAEKFMILQAEKDLLVYAKKILDNVNIARCIVTDLE